MSESSPCPSCGRRPCACGSGDGAEDDPIRAFSLLPCPGERLGEEEERFTRLLREVKADVVHRPFVQDEGRALLARLHGLDRLVERDRLTEADQTLDQALDGVLQFPLLARRRTRGRLFAVAVVFLVLLAAAWFLLL